MADTCSEDEYGISWTDHHERIISALGTCLKSEEFYDVTIVCQTEEFRAHRVILSCASPTFKHILKRHPASNPVLVFTDFMPRTMELIIQYIYAGSVDLQVNEVNELVRLARFLKIEGIGEDDQGENNGTSETAVSDNNETSETAVSDKNENKSDESISNSEKDIETILDNVEIKEERISFDSDKNGNVCVNASPGVREESPDLEILEEVQSEKQSRPVSVDIDLSSTSSSRTSSVSPAAVTIDSLPTIPCRKSTHPKPLSQPPRTPLSTKEDFKARRGLLGKSVGRTTPPISKRTNDSVQTSASTHRGPVEATPQHSYNREIDGALKRTHSPESQASTSKTGSADQEIPFKRKAFIRKDLKKSTFYRGSLSWNKRIQDQVNKVEVPCSVTCDMYGGLPIVNGTDWPPVLSMDIIPREVISNVGSHFIADSQSVKLTAPNIEMVQDLGETLSTTSRGVIQLAKKETVNPKKIEFLILSYDDEAKEFVGNIPRDKSTFFFKFWEEIRKYNMSQKASA